MEKDEFSHAMFKNNVQTKLKMWTHFILLESYLNLVFWFSDVFVHIYTHL